MKFKIRPSTAEAFRYGIDPTPDWFYKLIEDGRAAIFKDSTERDVKACIAGDGYCVPVYYGSVVYTVDNFPGEIFVRNSISDFLMTYERVKDDE